MFSFKKFPTPIKEKFISLVVIGIIFWLIGICITFIFDDLIMFILSVLVCAFSFIKAAGLYITASNGEYEIVKGTCVSISPILIRKQKKVKITDTEGNERLILLGRHSKVSIGTEYNFYFKATKTISLGQEYFDSVLAADCFLGYEEIKSK